MSSNITAKKRIEFIKDKYLVDYGFDLTDSKNRGKPFYDNYQLLLTLDPNSEQFNFIIYHSLFGPIEYLESVKKVNLKAYKRYLTRLTKNINNVGFYGDMFELWIAWTLFQKKVVFNFCKPPKPDFEITYNNRQLGIECTGLQFDFHSSPKKEKMLSKIKEKVLEKMKNDYANYSTALIVDITNLFYHSMALGDTLTRMEVRRVIDEAIQELEDTSTTIRNGKNINNFGFIILFCFNSAKTNDGQPNWVLNIFDMKNMNADKTLIQFLKENLIGNVEITNIETHKFHH